MKKLLASITLLIVVCCYLLSCEKDDICAEGTPVTPSLIVEFYDYDNRTAPRNVDSIAIYIEGADTIKNGTINRIEVPLKVDSTSVKWGFTWNRPVTNGVLPNTDFLEFKYSVKREYVSRACGYRTVFKLENDTEDIPNPVLTDAPAGDNLWIRDIDVENVNIENEDEAHIKIYF